jgi:hypothetical protein
VILPATTVRLLLAHALLRLVAVFIFVPQKRDFSIPKAPKRNNPSQEKKGSENKKTSPNEKTTTTTAMKTSKGEGRRPRSLLGQRMGWSVKDAGGRKRTAHRNKKLRPVMLVRNDVCKPSTTHFRPSSFSWHVEKTCRHRFPHHCSSFRYTPPHMSDIYGRRPSGQAPAAKKSPAKAHHADPAAVSAPSAARVTPRAAEDRNPTLSASGSPRAHGSFSKNRTRSGERSSASPARSSSAYARSASGLTSTSRYDAVSSRLQMEEDLWSQHVENSSRHRQDVRERAQQLEEAAKQRARETLKQDMERSRECLSANLQQFQKHLDRSHELQAIRQEHVDKQAEARRTWETNLAKTTDERTELAERRHLEDLARKREETAAALEARTQAAKERLSHLERVRRQQQQEKEARDSEAARTAYRSAVQRRNELYDKKRAESDRALTVAQRAKQIEQRRVAEQLAKEREAERRSTAAQRAHQEELARRRERKEQAEEAARAKTRQAAARAEARRAEVEAHFQETLAVGEETRMHNKRVARTATKWF